MRISGLNRATIAALLAAVLPTQAFAHHVMDGKMPQTFGQGMLSGLAHPIIGVDHLAFIVGVGIVAALAGLGLWLPVLFVVCMCVGIAAHLASMNLPAMELLVSLSVVLIGTAIVWNRSGGNRWIEGALFAAAGSIHGYALAESIIGAERTPLAAYIVGLVLIQSCIAVGAYLGVRAIATRQLALPVTLPRAAGVAILLAGLWFMAGAAGLVS